MNRLVRDPLCSSPLDRQPGDPSMAPLDSLLPSRTLYWRAALALMAVAWMPVHGAGQALEGAPRIIVGATPFDAVVVGRADEPTLYRVETSLGRVLAQGEIEPGGSDTLTGLVVQSRGELPIRAVFEESSSELVAPYVPGWFSLLPPLVAIFLALAFREVIVSLFAGVWLGALALEGFNPLTAAWRVVDEFAVPALGDTSGQTQIVVFSLLLGGMVGVITRNGGTRGIVASVAGWATTVRRGKLATWGAGMAIFFDDYANTLIVGNTMRPVTDGLRISREKLAYLVDATAAPVAALVPLSTWVGYEISLIGDGLRIAAEQTTSPAVAESLLAVSPLTVFVQTIPYRFYPLMALFLVFLTSVTDRDIGPMAAAEARAASGGGLSRPGALLATDTADQALQPHEGMAERWWNAALPVLTVIIVVLWGLYATGRASAGPDASLTSVFGEADPFATLLWGSLAGCMVAAVLSVGQGILSLQETIGALMAGMRAMMIAVVILVLAWSLGSVTEVLQTAQYLSGVLSERLPIELLPAIVFLTAAAISFATGTSWGTMAILLPLVIPLAVSLGGAGGGLASGGQYSILLGVISSVLAGAIFGDHCSPISDTTVLSSMASSCDHVDHVRTQLPYAVLVAAITVPLGDVGTAYGVPVWVALGGSAVILFVILRGLGRPVGQRPVESSGPPLAEEVLE